MSTIEFVSKLKITVIIPLEQDEAGRKLYMFFSSFIENKNERWKNDGAWRISAVYPDGGHNRFEVYEISLQERSRFIFLFGEFCKLAGIEYRV